MKKKKPTAQELQSQWNELYQQRMENRVMTRDETPEEMTQKRQIGLQLGEHADQVKKALMEAVDKEMQVKIKAFKRAIVRGDQRPEPETEDGKDFYAAWSSDEPFFDYVQDSAWALDEGARDRFDAIATAEMESVGLGASQPAQTLSEEEYQAKLEASYNERVVEDGSGSVLANILKSLETISQQISLINQHLGLTPPGFKASVEAE